MQERLKAAEESGDETSKAILYTNLAFEAQQAGNKDLAKEYATKALPYYQDDNDEVKAINSTLIENLEKLANG